MALVAVPLFVLSALLLTLAVQSFASPGSSAQLLAQHLRGEVFMPLSHGFWGGIARALQGASPGQVVWLMNLFSALCGATSIALVAFITANIHHNRTHEERISRGRLPSASAISGLFAGLVFLAAPSLWIVATRAHVAPFEYLLLLVPFALLTPRLLAGRSWLAPAACILWAMGATQYATILAVTPYFAFFTLFRLWRERLLTVRLVAASAVALLAGLSLYLLQASQYVDSTAFQYRGFKGFWDVVDVLLREQYATLVHGLPRVGWLTIGLVSVLPWVITLMIRHIEGRHLNQFSVMGSVMLNVILLALSVHVLSGGLLSPWQMSGGTATLLVFPYMLIAIWTGYLAGYWYLVLSGQRYRGIKLLGPVPRGVFLVCLAAFIGYRIVCNWQDMHPAAGAPVAKLAERVVEESKGKKWVFLATPVDDSILLAAPAGQESTRWVSVGLVRHPSYRRFLADQFTDPRLSSMAMIGVTPLLSEWAASDPQLPESLAVVGNHDLLVQCGFQPIPHGSLILASSRTTAAELDAGLEATESAARAWMEALAAAPQDTNALRGGHGWCAMYLSRQNNNLGVLLDEQGREEHAAACYTRALELEPANLSALLNQLAKSRNNPAEEERLNKLIEPLLARTENQYRIWNLSMLGGYVRAPEIYIQRGWAWASSGRPRAALDDMRKALAISGGHDAVKLHLAQMYLREDQPGEGEAYYLQVLSQQPTNRLALKGLVRSSVLRGQYDAARQYAARLGELGEDKATVEAEEAMIDYLDGARDKALEKLVVLARGSSASPALLAMTAVVADQCGKRDLSTEFAQRLAKSPRLDPAVRFALARLHLSRGDLRSAAAMLELLIREQPTNEEALELMVRIHFAERNRAAVEQSVEKLLGVNSRNGFGNYALGSIYAYREQYPLAEIAFRAALREQSSPELLGDLAWVLSRQKRLDEALEFAKKSLELNAKNATAWGVSGEALLEKGRDDEAISAYEKAISLRPETAVFKFGLMRAYERKGLNRQALQLAEELMKRMSELPPSFHDDLRALLTNLRRSV